MEVTDRGLYCPAGDFYVDPWQPVDRAIITHAHADHACPGCRHYLSTQAGEGVLRLRVGPAASIQTAAYGEIVTLGRTRISLHPAGHILGSAQVRIESAGAVWVISGDYKTEPDPTCEPFEPIRCHAFVTESTFGLPIYRWPAESSVLADVRAWWRANQEAGKASLVFAYALGKAQRLLAGLEPETRPDIHSRRRGKSQRGLCRGRCRLAAGPPRCHGRTRRRLGPALIVAPPSARGTPWTRRFGALSTAFVSGWMQIRGTRRRRAIDRGFILSDHADWPGLLAAVQATGAEQVWVTHGYAPVLARWLAEKGLDARAVPTRFEGERDDAPDEVPAAEGET